MKKSNSLKNLSENTLLCRLPSQLLDLLLLVNKEKIKKKKSLFHTVPWLFHHLCSSCSGEELCVNMYLSSVYLFHEYFPKASVLYFY